MASAPIPERNADETRRRVIDAIRRFPFDGTTAWQQLESLSPHFEIEGIEIEPEGVIVSGQTFRGAINLYVLLRFPTESIESAEAFLGHFEGAFENDAPVISNVELNLRSFFA